MSPLLLQLAIALALLAILAPYVLYPIVLWLRARFAPRAIAAGDVTPRVDLLICAHDEAASIGERLENALALDYPSEQLRIWVASDGSTDGTVAIARGFAERGVRTLDLPRGGKAAALAAVVEASGASAPAGEILAFSDANSLWTRDALRALVRPFADPGVGGVAGDQRYADGGGADAAIGERSYWSYDRTLKRWQSRAGNVVSSTGAIHAVRRALFEPPPPDATDDFMISTGVIARGHRLVFAPEAIALERPAESGAGEFRRKVRIITRGLRAVVYRRALLDPGRTGLYALELALHKLWRRLAWIPLLGLVLLAPFCLAAGGWLAALGAAMLAGVTTGIAGLLWPDLGRLRPVALAAYVVMVNAACAVATWNAVRGRRVARWDTERPGPPPSASTEAAS